jgi:hypothetical protein
MWKYQNTPKDDLFFVFSKAKSVILLYMKIEKTWNIFAQQPIFFF